METAQRLEKLQKIEQDVCKMLTIAADGIKELSQDNPSKGIVDHKTKEFVKILEAIEKGLSEQISYLTRVSTSQPHEGSAYGAEKDYELMCLQVTLAKQRLQNLLPSNMDITNTGFNSNGSLAARRAVNIIDTPLIVLSDPKQTSGAV